MNRSSVILLLALVSLLVPAVCAGQISPDQQKASDRILDKIQKIDLYNQILPVLMTPEQLKSVLPAIEKYRSEFKKLQLKEFDLLKGLEKDLDASIADIKKSDGVPDPAVVSKYMAHLQAFAISRQALFASALTEALTIMKAKLNSGQIAAAANSLNPRKLGSETDPTKFTQDQKFSYWVEVVMFDQLAYDILVDLSKKK